MTIASFNLKTFQCISAVLDYEFAVTIEIKIKQMEHFVPCTVWLASGTYYHLPELGETSEFGKPKNRTTNFHYFWRMSHPRPTFVIEGCGRTGRKYGMQIHRRSHVKKSNIHDRTIGSML